MAAVFAVHPLRVESVAWVTERKDVLSGLFSYAAYLGQSLCPVGLAPAYSSPGLSRCRCGGSARAAGFECDHRGIAGLLAKAPLAGRRLVFVSGDARAGDRLRAVRHSAEADRFTHLPQIGLAIAMVWAAADAMQRHCRAASGRRLRFACRGAGRFRLAANVVLARQRNALETRVFSFACRHDVAHNNLGAALAAHGRTDEAISRFRSAIAAKPDYPAAHMNLAQVLASRGRIDKATDHCRKTLVLAGQQRDRPLVDIDGPTPCLRNLSSRPAHAIPQVNVGNQGLFRAERQMDARVLPRGPAVTLATYDRRRTQNEATAAGASPFL